MTETFLVLTVLTSGLLAGFFVAFWCAVMIGLRSVDDRTFVVTMQKINAALPNARFVVPFFAPLPLAVVAAVLTWGDSAAGWYAVATVIATAATFLITAALNIPLNNRLAEVTVGESDAVAARARAFYEQPWVRWNDLRTLTSTAGFVASVMALIAWM